MPNPYASTPWITSDQLVESVKLNIMFPIAQNTFTPNDILNFANKELITSQVPEMLKFHEEFFVRQTEVPLQSFQSRYNIPERAIGLRLRDFLYRDSSYNLTEMTRITGDEDYFEYGSGSGTPPYKYKLVNDEVQLIPHVGELVDSGYLVFDYFLRPNQLVPVARAAIITNFLQSITVTTANVVAGDTVSINVVYESTDPNPPWAPNRAFLNAQVISNITFTAVTGAPSNNLQFQIGGTDAQTATNLAAAITSQGTYSCNNGVPATNLINVSFNNLQQTIITSNPSAFLIPNTMGFQFNQLPSTYTDPYTNITTPLYVPGVQIDFLQTAGGHRTYSFDITIQNNAITSNNTVSQTNVILFPIQDIPLAMVVGDYICLSHECIIPQIPSDLHEVLSERVSARVQRALGDQAGLQATMQKVQEMEGDQAAMIDNRTEGTPQKVLGRHTFLKVMARRRSHLRGW